MSRTAKISPSRWALHIFSVLVLLALIAPILIIVTVSFGSSNILEFPPHGLSLRWYEAYLGDPLWRTATAISVEAGTLTAVVSLVMGFAISLALVRYRFPGKEALRVFLMSPLVVPKIIIAIGLYFLYVQLRIFGSLFGLVMAHSLIAVPYVVMILTAALFGFDRRLEWAAQTLGAHPLRAFWTVTLPNIKPALLSAALFAFIASFDDIILSLFLTKLSAPTLPRQIWVNVQQIIDPTIAAVSTVMTMTSVAGLSVVALIQRRSAR